MIEIAKASLVEIIDARITNIDAIVPDNGLRITKRATCGACGGVGRHASGASCGRCNGGGYFPPRPVEVEYTISRLLGEPDLVRLGFARTGRIGDPHAMSETTFSDAIRGFIDTSDEFTSSGILLPGCPSRERARYENLLAQRGWLRSFPSRETMLLKYPPPKEPEKPVKAAKPTGPHWSDSPKVIYVERIVD